MTTIAVCSTIWDMCYKQWADRDIVVIGCLSGFNDTITYIPQDSLAQQAFDCTSSTCKGDVTGNYYQTLYYIQVFLVTQYPFCYTLIVCVSSFTPQVPSTNTPTRPLTGINTRLSPTVQIQHPTRLSLASQEMTIP